MLIRIGIAARLKGVSPSTLRRWEKEEKMQPVGRTRGGHRRYKLIEIVGEEKRREKQHGKVVIGYARVSANKQRKELERQQEQMRTFASKQGWEMKKVFTDIASGMNEKRKGLHKLLNEVATTQPYAIMCTYEDRLARFGTEVIKQYCHTFATKIYAIHQPEGNSGEGKLVEDMIALVTSFAGRLHRQRRGKAPPLSE